MTMPASSDVHKDFTLFSLPRERYFFLSECLVTERKQDAKLFVNSDEFSLKKDRKY